MLNKKLIFVFLVTFVFKTQQLVYSQSIEWEKFFPRGSSINQMVDLNDSTVIAGCNYYNSPAKVYLLNISGNILDSISLGKNEYFVKILKSNENELFFVLHNGTIVVTNFKLEIKRSYNISNNYISNAFLTDNELIILGSEYLNSKTTYYEYFLTKELQNISTTTISDYSKYQINYIFPNKDHINIFKENDTYNVLKSDSNNKVIWHKKFNKDTLIYSVKELNNGDLVLLGQSVNLVPVEQTDLLVIRMSNNGEIIWIKNYPPGIRNASNNVYKYANQIKEDQVENLYIVGNRGVSLRGPISETMILKLDKSGNLIWEKYKHYCEGDIYNDIIINSRNEIFIVGTTCLSDVSGVQNGIVLKINFNTSLNEISHSKFEIYPNPVSNSFILRMDDEVQSLFHSHVKIINLLGATINNYKINSVNNEIDVSSLPSGSYILQLRLNDGTSINRRFIKI